MKLSFSRLPVIRQLLFLPVLVIFSLSYFFAPAQPSYASCGSGETKYKQYFCVCTGEEGKCHQLFLYVNCATEDEDLVKNYQSCKQHHSPVNDCKFSSEGSSCGNCPNCRGLKSDERKPMTVYCCQCGSGPTGSDHCVEKKYEVVAANLTDAKDQLSGVTNCSETKGGDERCAINVPKPKPNKPPINIPILDPGSVGGILGSMNPLGGGGAGACSGVNLTIGCILGFIINTIIFPLAAIFFALMIVWGGYKIVAGGMSGSQNQVSAGKQRLIGAILGLLLLASVYWIWQLIEYLTGIKVVS